MPGTLWRPSPHFNTGSVTRPPYGAILHTADGTFDGTISWQQNPTSDVSSYFVTAKDGRIAQCVDTDNKAWSQGSGNAAWIGIENEGHGETGEPLTDPQLGAVARIYAWLHDVYDVALQSTDDPNGRGLGWHGMGAAAGWGHPGCPGQVIKAQRPEILRRASLLVAPSTGGTDMTFSFPSSTKPPFVFRGAIVDLTNRHVTLSNAAECNPSPSVIPTNQAWLAAYGGRGAFVVVVANLAEYDFTLP